jgi:hypothetical protein
MNIERVRERLKKHEAVIPWTYLDTTGHVTVECDLCLETVAEAKTLPFADPVTRAPATPEAIDQGLQKVQAAPVGRLARFYRGLSTVDLPPDAIDRIPDGDTVWCWKELCRLLPEVRGYPDHVQEALLDLAYNLGPAGLMARKSPIAAGRWATSGTMRSRGNSCAMKPLLDATVRARTHDDEDVSPPGPDVAQRGPKQPVQGVQFWTWPSPLEDGDLLSESEDLNCSVVPTAEEDPDSRQESNNEFEHELYVAA